MLIFNSHLYKYVLIDPPDGPSLVIYGNALLPFTTNSTSLTIVNKNISYNKKFQISYIYTTKIANTCTERVTHFGDSLAVDTCTPGVHIFTDDIKYYNYHPIRLTSPFLPPQ